MNLYWFQQYYASFQCIASRFQSPSITALRTWTVTFMHFSLTVSTTLNFVSEGLSWNNIAGGGGSSRPGSGVLSSASSVPVAWLACGALCAPATCPEIQFPRHYSAPAWAVTSFAQPSNVGTACSGPHNVHRANLAPSMHLPTSSSLPMC